MSHQLSVIYLHCGKFTIKRYVSCRVNVPSYKSIPNMPLFDTCKEAQEYRTKVGWFIRL